MGPEFHAGLCHLSPKWLQKPLFCSPLYLQIQTRVWHQKKTDSLRLSALPCKRSPRKSICMYLFVLKCTWLIGLHFKEVYT